MREIEDRVAVVTGGASGIGRATALEMAEQGMHVCLADVNEPGMTEVANLVRAKGRRAATKHTDVRDKTQMEALLAHTLSAFGRCDVAFNNAGVAHVAAFLDTSDAQWQRLIDIDLWGVIHGSRVFAAHFAAQRSGHIVNTASTAGLYGVPGFSAYVTAKFAVVGLSEVMRYELAEHGVGVTVVCPGLVRSNIAYAEGFGADHLSAESEKGASAEGLAKKIVRAIRKDQAMVLYGNEAYVLPTLKRLGVVNDVLGKAAANRILRKIRKT
jgi:NAD(P)-dependent dehydrogenase (short-subunit alcohol dehydrogenase family)